MIDWTKPIETTDGLKARVMSLLSLAMASSPLTPDADGFEPMMVWVKGQNNGGWGNVFLVNNEGFRCDDRALFSARQEPFIRNVKVKRVAWIKLRCIEWCIMAETKEAIDETISPHERNEGWNAVYAKWEE
jgi:hypothetical protein